MDGAATRPGGTRRYRARLGYDGTGFHGFAANRDVRTVGGELNAALGRLVGGSVEVTCAGRTDRGVHAQGQVVSFDGPADLDAAAVKHAVNKICGPEISVYELVAAPASFDARFSATSRTYRYRVLNRPEPDPFLHRYAWHVPVALDVEAMDAAAAALLGEHDFASFCRRPDALPDGRPRSLVRRVDIAEWVETGADGSLLEFWISASAFCHQMVRAITGTLVDVGRGRLGVEVMPGILEARSRAAAGQLAPPEGLTLWSVGYD